MKKKVIFPIALLCLFIAAAAFKENPNKPFKLKKVFSNSFCYVPNGTVTIDEVTAVVSAFYMSKTEVSNNEYTEFLQSVDDEDRAEAYAIKAQEWTEKMSSIPMAKYYHTHEAYQNYPVVNVTREAALAYCDWLTKKYASMDIGLPDDMKVVFSLPRRAEWVHAANGDLSGPYAWGGPNLRNARGQFLANFNRVGPENIHLNKETGEYEVIALPGFMGTPGNMNENADILAPVASYAANGNGLLNMNGNAAEMLADSDQASGGSWRSPGYDIRNESLMPFNEASPEVGFRPIAVFTKKK